MLMPQNARDTALALRRLKKRLPRDFKVSLGILYPSGREKGEHLFGSREAMEQALTDIAFEAGEIIEAPRPAPLMFRREGCDCAMGENINVRSDGSLFPCFKMEEPIGHIRRLSIGDALQELNSKPHPASELETCRDCALNTLCGGGCRSDNFLCSGSGEPVCGPWRVRVISELLAEDCTRVVSWSVRHLHAEAKRRGIDVPDVLPEIGISRHCIDA